MPKRKRSYTPGSSKRFKKTRVRVRSRSYRKRTAGARGRFKYLNSMYTTPRTVNIRSVGLPQTMIVKLRYKDYGGLTTQVSGAPAYVHWRLNSLFDPYYSVGGQQPRYFDQLCSSTLYTKYTVYRVDYKVTCRNRTTDADLAVGLGLNPTEDTRWAPASAASMYLDSELNLHQVRILNAPNEGGPSNRTVFMGTLHMAKIAGVTKSKLYAEDDFSAAYNGNPVITPMMTLAVADDPGQAQANLTMDYEIELVFHTKLWALSQAVPPS